MRPCNRLEPERLAAGVSSCRGKTWIAPEISRGPPLNRVRPAQLEVIPTPNPELRDRDLVGTQQAVSTERARGTSSTHTVSGFSSEQLQTDGQNGESNEYVGGTGQRGV